MIAYNEIKPKKIIILDGSPYEVLSSHVFRKQQRKPVNQTKLRHLITGKVTEYSFHQAEKVEEAEVTKRPIKYLYNHRDELWFGDPHNPKERFTIKRETVGDSAKFLKANTIVEAVIFDTNIIGVKIPIKIELKVTETPPGVRGDTAQGGTKTATLETGVVVNVPLFVNEGDRVEINTETGKYVQRV